MPSKTRKSVSYDKSRNILDQILENDDDDDEKDFFESCDKVPSRVSFCLDVPSSSSDDDDEDCDDVRISFASAVGPPSHLRSVTFSRNAKDRLARDFGEEDDDDEIIVNTSKFKSDGNENGGESDDYDVWMAEPLSIEERRRRLLQGFQSNKDINVVASSRRQSMPAVESDAVLLQGDDDEALIEKCVTRIPTQTMGLRRCRSDTEMVFGRSSESLQRSASMPRPLAHRRRRSKGGEDDCGTIVVANEGGVCRVKNLETGKELIVSEMGKDGSWGRLNDAHTGLQVTVEEFEKFIGNSSVIKELLHRAHHGGASDSEAGHGVSSIVPQITEKVLSQCMRSKSTKSTSGGSRKKGSWLKNIKLVASPVSWGSKMGSKGGGEGLSEVMKVRHHGKSHKELSGLYLSQEIKAHEGSIWTMKFSCDARYLASAGEDKIVQVWQVQECDANSSIQPFGVGSSANPSVANGSSDQAAGPGGGLPPKKIKKGKSKKRSLPDYIVMPEVVFSLSDKPFCSFKGHLDDVLDLSWSKSQHLLSSSMDKTVRLWDMETKACLKMFAHNDYVTCVQFNPVDESYFISGALDAKVRIWSIPSRQVVDWTDLHEMVTAACYTPDGQGALVGSHKGCCRMYKTTDSKLTQECQIDIRYKKKKSHAKKVTGFQFAPDNPSEVMITSADSQIRVFDGVDMIQKYRGFKNTSSQMASIYTSDGRYVICASEDSHVYVWKRDTTRSSGGKGKGWSTTRSYEHFFCKDVSVAIPWPNSGSNCPSLSMPIVSQRYNQQDAIGNDSQRSNIGMDDIFSSEKGTATSLPSLPPIPKKNSEQKLPATSHTDDPRSITNQGSNVGSESFTTAGSSMRSSGSSSAIADSAGTFSSFTSWGWGGGNNQKSSNAESPNAWGLVVVTASLGGEIRIYQNIGLPVRLSRQTNLF